MISLLISIVSSTLIFVILRLLPKWGAITLPAIVVNYGVAALCGWLMIDSEFNIGEAIKTPWFKGGAMIGVLFISLFYLMAYASQRIGIGVASMATKMSLVIPVAWFMIRDPDDQPSTIKILAVILALIGVILSSSGHKQKGINWTSFFIPLIIFIGSGIIELVLGSFSDGETFKSENERHLFTSAPFITSVIIGAVVLTFRAFQGHQVMNMRSIQAGILMGLVNFASINFLVKTYDSEIMSKSAIVSINNLGIVLLSALAAMLFFKEKIGMIKAIGLAFGVLAIVLLLQSS